jgi:hypothetical protein
VVIKLWDWRRMVVPLSYFIEKPFQNWTRETSALIGSVFLYVDYTVPVEKVREKLMEVARASPLWDGRVVVLQVSDATGPHHRIARIAQCAKRTRRVGLALRRAGKADRLSAGRISEALPRTRQEFVARGQRHHSERSPPSLVPDHHSVSR